MFPSLRRPVLVSFRLAALWCAAGASGALLAQEAKNVSFETLAAFTFTPPPVKAGTADKDLPRGLEQIPEAVRVLDSQRVDVTGFMLPVRVKDGLVSEFLLLRNQSACCYGQMPALTEWVVVKMSGKGTVATMDVPVAVRGTLRVGARYESGFITGIYALDAESVGEAPPAPTRANALKKPPL